MATLFPGKSFTNRKKTKFTRSCFYSQTLFKVGTITAGPTRLQSNGLQAERREL